MIDKELKILEDLDIGSISNEDLSKVIISLGANQEHIEPFNTGTGLLYWQNEKEFAEYLKFIFNFKESINSYLEIGCRWGGTFIIVSEILKKKQNLRSTCFYIAEEVSLYANDIISMQENLKKYKKNQNFEYFKCDSLKLKENLENVKQIDMIFVDGNHHYEHVMKDYETALQLNPKILVFHDISSKACPGSAESWNDIKTKHTNTLEIRENNFSGGYGIIVL